jgi:cysteinyl-tRNA synthetase
VPQNGIELVTNTGEEDGALATYYLNAIDGNGQEDLFYGYIENDEPTPESSTDYLRTFLDKSHDAGNVILVTDYCYTHSNMDDSYAKNNAAGYVSFAADNRQLYNIPDYPVPIYSENNNVVVSLNQAKNFLYLINPAGSSTKADFIDKITATNYDLLIMDYFLDDGTEFSLTDIAQLKQKANGGQRLLLAYMSIGEAEDYRYYWQENWNSNKPYWIVDENPDWKGNYKVEYWSQDWRNIIYGNDESYLKKIINGGFDGVYLDIIDAFEYFEDQQ